jgi:type IX secretion system PorP/SprF family membrane protein
MMAGVQYSDLHNNMTFGGHVVNDQFGPTDFTELQLNYAYRLNFERQENHFLSLGLNITAMQLRVQASAFEPDLPDDPLLTDKDQSRIVPNVGLGIHYLRNIGSYRGGTFMQGGLSAQQLIPSRVQFNDASGGLDRVMHLYGYASLRHYYTEDDFVEPFGAVRYALSAPIHYDLGFRMSMAQRHFQFGAGLSSTFQFHWQVGFQISDIIKLTYTNNIFMGRTVAQSSGATHELVLSFRTLMGW